MKVPEQYYFLKPNLIFCVAAPLFMLLFMITYCPTFSYNDASYAIWNAHDEFCIPILAAIELGTLLASRAILCYALVRHNLTRIEIIAWFLIEFIIASLFFSLFLSLYFRIKYFLLLPRVFVIGFCINIFPYLFYWIIQEYYDRDRRLSESLSLIDNLRRGIERNETGAIRFNDEKGITKLVVSSERVISLESAGNYVTILYDDDGTLMRYSLRNSLKGIENICNANGLERCHRSFFINVNMIKVIRRTPQGVFAEMNHPGVQNIPISKTYAPDILRLFSDN